MKLKIFTDKNLSNEHIDIYCKKRSQKMNSIIGMIRDAYTINIIGFSKDSQRILQKSDIFYFESVDKKCFAYTKDDTYLVHTTLRDLEDNFNGDSFIRINKSTIVNIYMINNIKSDLNMRTIVNLSNNEKLVITRHYKKEFSQRLYNLKNSINGGSHEDN